MVHVAGAEVDYLTSLRSLTLEGRRVKCVRSSSLECLELFGPGRYMIEVRQTSLPGSKYLPKHRPVTCRERSAPLAFQDLLQTVPTASDLVQSRLSMYCRSGLTSKVAPD